MHRVHERTELVFCRKLERQILHSIPKLFRFQNLSGDLQVTNSLPDCQLELMTIEEAGELMPVFLATPSPR